MADKEKIIGVVIIAAIGACFFPAAAVAADGAEPTAAGAITSVAELRAVQVDTFMLRAQNARAEEAERLALRQPKPEAAEVDEQRVTNTAPVVARVSGLSSDPTAYLLMSNGSIVPSQKGTELVGGYTVVSVSASRVMVKHGGRTFALGFAASPRGHSASPRAGEGRFP